jgi:hypothetical protein
MHILYSTFEHWLAMVVPNDLKSAWVAFECYDA